MNRKMLVRAFAKVAKKWNDSKRSGYCLSRYGYKNARQYARLMADSYDAEMLEDFAKWIDTPLKDWCQFDYDYFAEEEISCW